MMRPTIKQILMEVAHTMAKRSTCERLNVGCVIAQETRIVSTGWNGAPSGMNHCPTPHSTGPCANACHAELNAIAWAARHGVKTLGAWAVCTHQPCLACAQLIINAGISRVIYSDTYRDNSGLHLLQRADIIVEQLKYEGA